MKHHVTLIRSAATPLALRGCYVGLQDEPVDEAVKRSLDEWHKQIPRADRVYSGGYLRCRETAEMAYPGREIEILKDLMPCDYGDFTRATFHEMRQDPRFEDWARSRQPEEPLPGADFFRQTERSLREESKRIFDRVITIAGDQEITHLAIVAHGSFIRHVMNRFGAPRNYYLCVDVPQGAIVPILYDSNEGVAFLKKHNKSY